MIPGPRLNYLQEGKKCYKDYYEIELPDCLMVRILGFHYHGPGSIPGRVIQIP